MDTRNLVILSLFATGIFCLVFAQNASAASIVATIPVGIDPYGIAYDHAKGEMFVTNYQSHSVSVINDTTNTVVATIHVGNSPNGIAYDFAKKELFVTNLVSNSVTVFS